MIAYCNYIPDAVWIREVENGVRHVTLRRNFLEKITPSPEGTPETQYQFEETDVYIPDRDNLDEFITANFDELFISRLGDYKSTKINELNATCNNLILSGFVSSCTGVEHQYKFDMEYQANMAQQGLMLLMDNSQTIVMWPTLDTGVMPHTKEQFIQLCKDAQDWKAINTYRYFGLKAQIMGCESESEVDKIKW